MVATNRSARPGLRVSPRAANCARVTPEGARLPFGDATATEFNSQRVYHSSEFGVRDIDLIYSPYLKFAMGDMDDGWSDLPPGY